MPKPLSILANYLLKANKIKIDNKELIFQIESHPSYPSLYAVKDVFNHFNIENLTAKVFTNEEMIGQLPSCFMAQINLNGREELVVVKKIQRAYEIVSSTRPIQKVSLDQFLSVFTGVVVVVESSENMLNKTSNIYKGSLLYLSILFFIGLLSLTTTISLLVLGYSLLSAFGLAISYGILSKERGISNSIGNLFCSESMEKANCTAVLQSNGSMFLKRFKLSEISLIYFAANLLSVTLNSVLDISQNYLFALSLLATPMVFYSVYYQSIVLKKWCGLCLAIVSILGLQASFSLFVLKGLNPEFNLEALLVLLFSFTFISGLWKVLKIKGDELYEGEKNRLELYKLKRNHKLFSTLLGQSSFLKTTIPNKGEIILGNKNSTFQITLISSPFCRHCSITHQLAEELLSKHGGSIKILIRLNIDVNSSDSDLVKVCCKILELYQHSEEECKQAMSEIYNGIPAKIWLKNWGETKETEKYVNLLRAEKEWCSSNGINFTPELLILGRAFPKEYAKMDLLYHIEQLYETYSKASNASVANVH